MKTAIDDMLIDINDIDKYERIGKGKNFENYPLNIYSLVIGKNK